MTGYLKGIIKKVLRTTIRVIRLRSLFESSNYLDVRRAVAKRYLFGEGIEVGALHSPLDVPSRARVRYMDRMSKDGLREHYPELKGLPLVDVDIIDDGERLTTIADGSQDFVIANHFLEHCQDPIGALGNFLRVLRTGGVLYLAVPDKRFTFDIERPVTAFEHLIKDHKEGPELSRRAHCLEFADLVDKAGSPEDIEKRADRLIETDYSIHFHVWTVREMVDFISRVQEHLKQPFDCELIMLNHNEVIIVLSRLQG